MPVRQDLQFALRLFRRTPVFTLTALLTLALGIGASTAVFSVVDAVLLGPLPYSDPDDLVVARNGHTRADSTPISYEELTEWQRSGALDEMAGWFNSPATLTGEGDAEQLEGIRASASLFTLIQARMVIGAPFTAADEFRSADRKVVISEGLWRRRFGGAPDVLGRRIALSDATFTIVGVLGGNVRMRPTGPIVQFIMPLRLSEETAPASLHFITALGRLPPGHTARQAQDALQAVTARLYPGAEHPTAVVAMPIRAFLAGDSTPALLALFGAVGLLLAVACANLANLLLARAAARRQEMQVRLALGVGRARLMQQLLTESLVLALAGGAGGVLLAWLGVAVARDVPALHEAGAFDVRMSLPVLGFALALSTVCGILFGLAPALGAARQPPHVGDATRVAGGHPRLRAALIVGEVALTLVLLVGAGLLMRSFANLLTADKGFDAEHVLTFLIEGVPDGRYKTDADRTRFLATVMERLAVLPGADTVGLVSALPLSGDATNGGVTIAGRNDPMDRMPMAEKRIASEDYFRALGIRLVQGRTFTTQDTADTPGVMVVSESFARRYFPDGQAIGARVGFNWDMDGMQEVVGIVSDVKQYGLDDSALPMVYVSYRQRPIDYAAFIIRTSGDPATLAAAARAAVRTIDPNVPLTHVEPMGALVTASIAARRFALVLVGSFAGIGLVLAATGLFGVVSYAVRQRSRELGVRMALGAEPGAVLRLVLRQGLVLALAGLTIGVLAAVGLGRVIQSQLFGVDPTDALTFAAVSAVMLVTSLIASYIPARWAVRIDPARALRAE